MMVMSERVIATPPGTTIKEQLLDRKMSQKEFAARMDLSEKHICRLLNGDVQLTPEVAVKLEMVLGVPAGFWNHLEAIYREKLVKIQAEKAMEADEAIARALPYSEMATYGWVPETGDIKERVINLRKHFEVAELQLLENKQITKIVCRRLAITDKSDLALMAWAQEAKIKARNIETKPISIKSLQATIPVIRKMTACTPKVFCAKLKSMMADCGVALVFLPHLKGSFLQGATFSDGKKIVVGLTVRGKDADKFWFSLFHEIAHIVLGHIEQSDGTDKADEDVADEWARNALIPNDVFDEIRNEPRLTKEKVVAFAKKIGIAPGIVVGRLQKEGCLKYNMMNDLKEKYSIAV